MFYNIKLFEQSEEKEIMTFEEYRQLIKIEVFENNKGVRRKFFLKYLNASTNAVYLIRRMQYLGGKKDKISKFFSALCGYKLISKYGIFVYPENKIGNGLKIPHPNGIIIGKCVEIGQNCTIFQQVTIGSSKPGDYKKGMQPKIGNDVWLFSGSKIIGAITVADKSVVGANAVLTQDTEKNTTYIGVPAKPLKTNLF